MGASTDLIWLKDLSVGDRVTTVDREGVRREGQVFKLLAFGQIEVLDERGVEVYVHESGHMVPDVYESNRPRIEPPDPLTVDPNERLLMALEALTAAVSMLAHEVKGLVESRGES